MDGPDPGIGTGYQINRQLHGHPDSPEASRKAMRFSEMGGDPHAAGRSVHPALVVVTGTIGLGVLVLSIFLYFWAGLFVSILIGLVACALIGATVAGIKR